jgi:hypothetical protein
MSDEFKDFRGTSITPGCKIVYASIVRRSARLTIGTVLSIGKPKSEYSSYKVSIKVQPHDDSWGTRWSNQEYDDVERKFVTKGDPKPVFLHFTDRLMVLKNEH